MKKIIRLTENDLHNIISKSVRTILEDLGGTSCFSVNSPAGSLSDPTGQQKNSIDVPAFGRDKETSDRHAGFSVDGKTSDKSDVQRRTIYNPKSGKKK